MSANNPNNDRGASNGPPEDADPPEGAGPPDHARRRRNAKERIDDRRRGRQAQARIESSDSQLDRIEAKLDWIITQMEGSP